MSDLSKSKTTLAGISNRDAAIYCLKLGPGLNPVDKPWLSYFLESAQAKGHDAKALYSAALQFHGVDPSQAPAFDELMETTSPTR